MEFGLKGMSRLVADVTGSRHSGLGFTVFWLFTAVVLLLLLLLLLSADVTDVNVFSMT